MNSETSKSQAPGAGGSLILFDSGPWHARVATQNLDQYHHGKVSDLEGFFDQLHVVSFPHPKSLTARFSPRHWFYQISASGPFPDIDSNARLAMPEAEGRSGFPEARSGLRLPKHMLPGSPAGTALAFLQAVSFARRLARVRTAAAVAANDPFLRGLAALMTSRSLEPALPFVLIVRGDYEQVRRLRDRPIVSFLRDMDLDRAFERWVFSQADLVIADRDYYARYALDHGAHPDRVAQVGMAVHQDFYPDPPGPWHEDWGEPGLDPDKPLLSALCRPAERYVLVVGRLSDEKYPMDPLEAVARARNETGLDILLILSGTGPLEQDLRTKAAALGMENALCLPGNLDRPRLARAMSECDALLAPCTGFALAEAALRAAPIVAYDWEWHGEIVKQDRTGLTAPFRDVEAMSAMLIRLLTDKALARKLGQEARKQALSHFAPGRNLENLRQAYRRVLA